MSEDTQKSKMVVICNHDDAGSVMPTLIMGSSGATLDYEVKLFFTPGGSKALLKGEIEKFRGMKGLPDPVKLYNDILAMGGEIVLCELALGAKDIDPANVREGVRIMNAPSFLLQADGATMTYTF
jgi:predicted peroxiredoxin